ncbi:T9SS type B sorting domain-containing protein [Abyssalbus ytuae]|uniref:T9SS type B sorting domain-containing protein n=1 Tax=Abyssalbus ytuae TaxID=2926907 RepID=A0A9E6ZSI1_9FLAO|nr:T9SS type B sorting domain-containing protein [Abyssalbus ytuae]UOB17053.1 T9SS type B sorting domain-containing protein [Abyssalbus ytuae]
MNLKALAGFICIIFIIPFSYSQGETSNWYFGENAGLRFNNDGTVSPVTNGQLNTREGCATISDAFGNLLFYTDGINVWNSNHQLMPNGTGLYGDPSSSQSAIIVPQPDNENMYFIFTVDTSVNLTGDPDFGFNYSVVDMTRDNNNGDVTSKNINLLHSCTEKISAVVKDCFSGSIWVMTFAANDGISEIADTFYSFEVNAAGVNTTPVKSTFSGITTEDPARTDARGYLKISPDGTKAATAHVRDGLYLYDFNVNTGRFSNQQKLIINTANNFPYGVEFSPNNQFLYVNTYNDIPVNSPGQNSSSLLQFDLFASDIEASQVILDERVDLYRGALQLGSNGKVYRALSPSYDTGSNFLGIINNPDLPGTTSDYQHNALNLGSRRSSQGLPPFIQSLFNKVDIIKSSTSTTSSILDLCIGESYTLQAENIPGATYVWMKDGTVLPNTTYSLEINNATSADSGLYEMEMTVNPGDCPTIGEAAVTVYDLPNVNNTSLTACDFLGNSDGITVFNLADADHLITNENNVTIEYYHDLNSYNNGDTPITGIDEYINSDPNQTLVAVVTNEGGCSSIANIDLIVNTAAAGTASIPHYFNCDENTDDNILSAHFDLNEIAGDFSGFNSNFYQNLDDLSYEENPLSGNLLFNHKTTIYVKLEDDDGNCMGVETFTLMVDEKPNLNIPAQENIICLNNPSLTLNASAGYDRYAWYYINQNNEETLISALQNPVINQAGNYRLEVSYIHNDLGTTRSCSDSEIITVSASDIATITGDTQINDLSSENSVIVIAQGEGDYEYSLNEDGPYQESNVFENVPPGFMTIYVRDKNGCGVSEKEIAVIGYPKFFTPNNDGMNDYWNIQGLSEIFQQNTDILIFDRFGKLITRVLPTGLGWNGTFNGKIMPATDYWFTLQLSDGRNFKGHFTLKR